MREVLVGLEDGGLSGGDAGDGHTEGAARRVVQAQRLDKLDLKEQKQGAGHKRRQLLLHHGATNVWRQ